MKIIHRSSVDNEKEQGYLNGSHPAEVSLFSLFAKVRALRFERRSYPKIVLSADMCSQACTIPVYNSPYWNRIQRLMAATVCSYSTRPDSHSKLPRIHGVLLLHYSVLRLSSQIPLTGSFITRFSYQNPSAIALFRFPGIPFYCPFILCINLIFEGFPAVP